MSGSRWKWSVQRSTWCGLATTPITWHSDPAEERDAEIEVDVAGSAFVLKLTDEEAEALDWTSGVYDIKAISPDGEAFPLTAVSRIRVLPVVTK